MRVRVKLAQMSKWMFLRYIFIYEILFSFYHLSLDLAK